jgi:hypothetical protein
MMLWRQARFRTSVCVASDLVAFASQCSASRSAQAAIYPQKIELAGRDLIKWLGSNPFLPKRQSAKDGGRVVTAFALGGFNEKVF